ncbi:hypothetical protein BU23DRAFT_585020 [Bimuria novae-zelandiae CBS 107.79]|uniref:Uncharacterized protein n=1 Tax=Bimuria novae-zelandiae CBS 107.79 TaxID=1447943 RepID=A0A6A5UNW5_9PLEO|nr:hypothetical protein BU23DRAFT_585020 [Bimuria novae-zelandiae CBS 107.79]
MEPPSQESARDDSLQRLTGSAAQVLEDTEPKKPTPSAAALGRSGTLSWQQRRPLSGSTRRPLSVASSSAERMAPGSPRTSEPPSPERPPSRTQIAQSLGAKDPSWFRQTADRGVGSAAYRKNQEDSVTETGSVSRRKQLPGMSRESTTEPEPEPEPTSPPPESARSSGSLRSSALLAHRPSASASLSGGDDESTAKGKTPLPVLDAQKFALPPESGSSTDGGDRAATRALAMSPTQGRISPERPSSPTKGMGGFVQSAIMKRSDSVSKRWSAQAPPTLSRQNSTLSNRGSTYGTLSRSDARPSTLSRHNSIEPSSRPTSSSSNATITRDAAESAQRPEFVKPALPRHSRSKSVASTFSEGQPQTEEMSPPSPSKRWSPTKSSWLENALNKKPESPKLQQPPPQQPAWMSELSRIKQQRGSVDFGKTSPLQSPPADARASGRSSPIKDVQLRPVSLRSRSESPKKEAAPVTEKPVELVQSLPEPSEAVKKEHDRVEEGEEPVQSVLKLKPVVATKPSTTVREDAKATDVAESPSKESESPKSPPAVTSAKPTISSSRFAKDPALSSPAAKPKPDTPPKKDFRATLKSRQPASNAEKKEEVNELQNVFGKLRRAETKNYVAPDTFKSNILAGKSALNVTGGPKPSVRRDEFRDSLVSQKAAMLAKAQETGSAAHNRSDSSAKDAPPPEAIAPPPPKETDAAPEAIARKQSLRTSKSPILDKPSQPATPLASQVAPAFRSRPPTMAGNAGTTKEDIGESPTKPPEEEKTGAKQADAKASSTPHKMNAEKIVPIAPVPSEPLKTDESPDDALMTRTPARNSLNDKPITPAKSPDLTKRLSKSPTPELPKKPASLELKREKSPLPATTQSFKPISSPSPSSFAKQSPIVQPQDPALKEIASPDTGSARKEERSPNKSSFSSAPASAVSSKLKSPIKLPTKADEQAAMEDAGLAAPKETKKVLQPEPLAPKPRPAGLGLGSLGSLGGLPYSAKISPISPPITNRPQSEPFKQSPSPEKPAVTTGELPENIDTIRFIRKQIHEVTGDGKLIPIHAHDEHVLFQDSIGSKTTEVYLWAGNGVADPTLEDNSGRLVPIRPGKETPNFIDALGGIIVTRRGAFPPAREHMLCGRRHLGRLVLCSGYAYIISTNRKVYLWKGRGCCAEELAGARLMGMDLAPNGDFLEIEEGAEPDEMLQVFPPSLGKGPAIPRSADHWRYKASSERYQARLFKIEQQQSSGWGSLQVSSYLPAMLRRPSWQFNRRASTEPKQSPSPPKSPLPPGMSTKIVEVMPFCQRDLDIIGSLSRSQHHAFSTALTFAQEYVILAVTEEDRPIKPPTTIVLEGVPRDMKAVFRHWDDSIVPAAGLMNGKLGRGKSLRIVSMEKALEATRRR